MDLKQLRYFDTVAETCHFGQAAERLHLAQPALSQAIRRLEAELGVLLLQRTTRQVRLTPAGEFLHKEVRRILGDLDASVIGVRSIAEGNRGLLRVGFTGTSAFTRLPALARVIRSALPGVVLEVQADLLTPGQVERLLDGRLDLGVLRGPIAESGLQSRTLAREPLVLALPADHRLVAEPALEVGDLSADGFVAYADAGSAVNEALRSSCRRAGFSPVVAHRAPNTAALLALVSAGLGVALVPRSARSMQLAGVVYRDLAGAAPIDLSLAWRTDDASAVVSTALDALESNGFYGNADDGPASGLPIPAEERA